MRKTMVVVVALATMMLAVLGGCQRLGQVQLVDEHTAISNRNVVMFFVDGVNCQVYQKMLTNGELPNIDKYLVSRGTSVRHGVTVIPSLTYAVTTTFGTGLVPGHHGILGNRYFDRDRLVYIDYNTISTYRDLDKGFLCPTIYEMLPGKYSVTIQTPLRRGAFHYIDNWASSGLRWFFRLYTEIDALTARRFEQIGKMARRSKRWPELIFAYMPATDEIGHQYGPYSPQYGQALRNVDEQIGRICKALQENGILESTYLIFVSDHGMAAVGRDNYFAPAKAIAKRFGMSVATEGPDNRMEYSKRVTYFQKYDAVVMNGGNRRGAVFLRQGQDWSAPVPVCRVREVAEFLAGEEAVTLVAYPEPSQATRDAKAGGHAVIVQNRRGKALVERYEDDITRPLDEKQYRYQVIDGQDPLGYTAVLRQKGLLDGQYHSGREWLEMTANTAYPDLPVGIMEIFDSRRAGNILLFAEADWDFSATNVGGHGSVLASDMKMPMVFAGPGIIAGKSIDVARTVDVAPTIVDMLGGKAVQRYSFDGKSLLDSLCELKKGNRSQI